MTAESSGAVSVATISEESGSLRAAAALLAEVFREDHFDEEYLKWKYFENPFGESILLSAWVTDDSGRAMAGFRSFWRWRFRSGPVLVDAAQPCDTAVGGKYRRRGVFAAMTRAALDAAAAKGVDVLFNNPNPESEAGYLKMGWRETTGLHWYGKPVRRAKVAREFVTWGRSRPPLRWTRPGQSWDGTVDDRLLASVLDEAAGAFGSILRTSRDARFYRWRYGKAPHRAYGLAATHAAGEPGGFLFYGTGLRGGLREVLILDFITSRPGANTAKKLVREVIEAENPDWITVAATAAFPFLNDLRGAGFLSLLKTASVVVRHMPGVVPAPLALTLGDIDTF